MKPEQSRAGPDSAEDEDQETDHEADQEIKHRGRAGQVGQGLHADDELGGCKYRAGAEGRVSPAVCISGRTDRTPRADAAP